MKIEDVKIGMSLSVITRHKNPLSNSSLQRETHGRHTVVVDNVTIRRLGVNFSVDIHGEWICHSGYSKRSIGGKETGTKNFPFGFDMFDVISAPDALDSREDLTEASSDAPQHLTECGTLESQVSSGAQNGEKIMARRRTSVPQEINPNTPENEETPEMSETNPNAEDVMTDSLETPESDVNNSQDLGESVGENDAPDGKSSDEKSDDNSGESGSTPPEPEVPAFVIPDDPSELDLGEEMATMAGQRLLKLRKAIIKIDNTLRATDDENSEAAIVMFAESDDADENTKAQLAAVREAEEVLRAAMANLTDAVKVSRGDVTLTDEDKAAMREDRTNKVGMFKTTVKFIGDMAEMNEVPEAVTRFLASVEIPGTRKSGAARSGTSNYQQTTTVRPRLGDGGYIEIDGADTKFSKFTDAIKWLRANGAKEVTTGAIHNAWADAGNFNISDWVSAPTDVTFQIGSGENVHQISIHFTYNADSTAA